MFNRAENPQIDNIENPHFCTFLPAQDDFRDSLPSVTLANLLAANMAVPLQAADSYLLYMAIKPLTHILFQAVDSNLLFMAAEPLTRILFQAADSNLLY